MMGYMDKIHGTFPHFMSCLLLCGMLTCCASDRSTVNSESRSEIQAVNAPLGSGSPVPSPFTQPSVSPSERSPRYLIGGRDFLGIRFFYNPELNSELFVRPDGKITLPLIGDIVAENRTPDDLRSEISNAYKEYIARTGYGEKLKENDDLQIRFVYNPELNQALAIRPDGKISMPLIGDVQAAGLTPEDLRRLLAERYSRHITKPDVAVLVGGNITKKLFPDEAFIQISVKHADKRIFVGGEVTAPKAISFDSDLTVLGAIMQAGGAKDTADLSKTVILRRSQPDQVQWIQKDLSKPLSGESLRNDIVLDSGDIVVVPMSGIAKVDLFVKQYIRDVLPLQSNFTVSIIPYDAGLIGR